MTDETNGPDASGPRLSITSATRPSEELIAKGVQPTVLDLPSGRKLHVRKPSPLGQFKLVEALGEVASNSTYVQMAMPLNYLGVIEDAEGARPVIFSTKLQIEGLITELGEEGMDALLVWFAENVMAPQHAMMEEARLNHEKALLKN